MGFRRKTPMTDGRESVYQFQFGGRRMKLFLAYTLVVFGLVFFLGFLLGKYSQPGTDWAAKAARESKERRQRTAAVRFTAAEALETTKEMGPKTVVRGDGMVKRLIPRKVRRPAGSAGKSPEDARDDPRSPVRSTKPESTKKAAPLRPARPAGSLALVRPSIVGSETLKTKLSSLLSQVGPQGEAEASTLQSGPVRRGRPASSPSGTRPPAEAGRSRTGWAVAKAISPSLDPEPMPIPLRRGLSGIRKARMPLAIDPRPAKLSRVTPARPTKAPRRDSFERPVRVRYSREGRYYILVGSHSNRRDALEQREALRRNAYPAFIRVSDLGAKGKRYRVLVGRYQGLERATEEAGRLARMEKVRPRVFKEGDADIP